MPRATVNLEDTTREDLKTAPPDGFVVLRRMSYGQVVQRRALMKLLVTSERGQKDFKGELAMASRDINLFEFTHCVVDHNLTDAADRKLNLGNPMDLDQLDPKVGQEIEKFISDMNNFEDDEGN